MTVTHDGEHTMRPAAYAACHVTGGWDGDGGGATLGVGRPHTFPVLAHRHAHSSFREAERAAHACCGNSNTVRIRTQGEVFREDSRPSLTAVTHV